MKFAKGIVYMVLALGTSPYILYFLDSPFFIILLIGQISWFGYGLYTFGHSFK